MNNRLPIPLLLVLLIVPWQSQTAAQTAAQNTRPTGTIKSNQAKRKETADRLLEQARRTASDWSKANRLEALKSYERAGRVYEAIGDLQNQLAVLIETGRIQECSGDAAVALTKYNRALTLAREGRDQRGEASALNRIGFWYIDRSDYNKAFDHGQKAHELSLSIQDRQNEAEALLLLGTASYHLRKIEPATAYLRSSQAIFSELSKDKNEPRVLEMMAHVNLDLGNNGEALRLFKEALDFAQRSNDLKVIGKILNGLAITYSILGEKQEAVDHYRKALAIFEKIGDRLHEAVTLNGLGFIYYKVGENQRSLNYYSRSVDLFKSVGDREGEGIALFRIGKNSEALWDKKSAITYYEKLRALTKETDDPIFESYAVNWIGDLTAASDMRQALSYYEQALALTGQNPRNKTYTLNRLGYGHAALGEIDTARRYYDSALQLAELIGDREAESDTLYNLASLARSRNAFAEAQSLIERSLKLIESLSADAGNRELRASYFATVHQHYELYIDLLMALHKQDGSRGFDSKALEASERSRARALLEMLGERRADIRQGVDVELLKQEQIAREKLTKAIQKRLSLFSRQHTEQEAEISQREILTLTTDHEQVLGQLRQKSPGYAALTQPVTLNRQQMQQLLDDETVMVEYAMGEQKSFAWVLTKESIDSSELPNRATLDKLARTVYEEISSAPRDLAAKSRRPSREEYRQAIESLSKILLDPLVKHSGKKRVIVVADGALQYIPFSILESSSDASDRRLISQHEIVNLPSASALAVQRQSLPERELAAKTLAMIADPVLELNDDRFQGLNLAVARSSSRELNGRNRSNQQRGTDLSNAGRVLRSFELGAVGRVPYAGLEAADVLKLIPAAGRRQSFVGFDANRKSILGADLRQYRILHFATHGFVDNEQPQLSGLMLSIFDEQGRRQDGFLTLHEIYNLKLSADLVVLSACKTALGKEIRGEGIVGLTRGFMYAGARQVVASLWRIDDAATAKFMKLFYEHMLQDQLKPADALRAAQRDFSKQKAFQHPYYWAGFVLQGDWK
ncbi:MAG TPA: CHAT domain-containing protein [Pyrinomonadaceae bacterium]|nr:CHAT domain-containing protein [Pyrinomonadaceae bacterium]